MSWYCKERARQLSSYHIHFSRLSLSLCVLSYRIVAEKGVCSVKARVYCYQYVLNKLQPVNNKVRFSNEVAIIYDYEYFLDD